MKRLRKLVSIALAWTSVCVLSVDPASACRLLNRRCCTCCCPVEPTCCVEQGEKSSPPAVEPSPSDQPRPMASDVTPPPALSATTTPTAPSIGLQPSGGVVRGTGADHAQPTASGHSPAAGIEGGSAPITESKVERRGTGSDQPAVTAAPLSPTSPPLRQPSDLSPSPIANAADTGPTANQPLTNAGSANVGPQKTTLTPKQASSAHLPQSPAAPSPDRVTGVTPGEPSGSAKTSIRENATEPIVAEGTAHGPARQPAAAAVAPAAGRVAQPEFPTVNDDPFTPVVSPSSAPAAAETHADDPFAPLPAAPATNEKPSEPLVTEPTTKKIDMLAPGADGRLPLREWTDNSGKFNVKAKLVLVLDGKVRLLKETGRTTTVALERLSKDDRAYVAAAVERYGEDLGRLHQFASR